MPRRSLLFLGALAALAARALSQEAMLQYFNTSWKEIERRIPEVAEAGYTSLWLPNPCKGSSGSFSVGYDPLDRFDLGDKNQSGTVATRYGTKADLLRLVEVAQRFGLRVYFDNVVAHSAGPLDNVNPGQLFPGIPGFVPEDFHLVKKVGGGWKKASDSIDYNDEWQVLNRNPFAWDIAQESPNTSFDPIGQAENTDYPKWVGVRHPGQTRLYPDNDLPGVTDANGVVFHPFADKEPFQDTGYTDGTVLVGVTSVGGGYIVYNGGGANVGAGNGRFDFKDINGNGQHDAGEPCERFLDNGVDATVPALQVATWGYGDGRFNMGNPVAEDVNAMLIRATRWTIDQTGCDGFRLDAVKHVPNYFFGQQSGNKDPSSAGYLGNAQAQFNLTHGYTDWSNHRNSTYSTNAVRDDLMLFGEHLGAPPNPKDYLDAGMRIANDNFANDVGGFSGIGSSMAGYDAPGSFTFGVDNGVMYCLSHDNNYMAGSERPAAHQYMLTRAGVPVVYTDGFNISGGPDYFPKPSYIPFLGEGGQNYITGTLPVRRDFMRGDQFPRWSSQDFCAWEFRDRSGNAAMSDTDATTIVVMHARNYIGGQRMPFGTAFANGARLRNFSPYGGSFYASVGGDGKLRPDGDLNPVIVPSGGYFAFSYDVPELPAVWQGSANVHPIDILENGTPVGSIAVLRKDGASGDGSYNYTAQIPLVRNGANLRFVAHADGAAENILMALDGGIDINSQIPIGPVGSEKRDNPPGSATDTYRGFEQMQFIRRTAEKFAAQNVARNVIGSPGAETWKATIGTGFDAASPILGGGPNTDASTAAYAYHFPTGLRDGASSAPQFTPQPAAAAGQAITVRVKTAYQFQVDQTWLYYTTDGSAPEGSAGVPLGTTRAVTMPFESAGADDSPALHTDWWVGTIPAQSAGTVLRYKIGTLHTVAASRFPFSAADVDVKKRMETVFQIDGFNATTATVFPHNDLDARYTGLSEGFHVLRTRAFLNRIGMAALFKTNTQTFYYDAQRPAGALLFPTENATIGGSTYGFVIATDASVTGVQFNILDSNAGNDSAANGNGAGNWATATEVTPSNLGTTGFAREWRFDYKSIPSSGAAIVYARLREASSSSNNALDDSTGWFTTLVRNINTGSAVNYRIQFPTTDGTVVDSNYIGKIYFNKSLGDISGNAVSATQMRNEFTISVDDVLIPRAGYVFIADETTTESAMSFHFPNLYTGNPNDLHELRATHQRGDVSLTDTRLVKAAPGAIVDSDGDGLPDYWEIQNGLDPNNPDGVEGDTGDPDGDGVSNALEFLADLNPNDASDGLAAVTPLISKNGATWKLQLRTIPNRRYQIEKSGDLTGWSNAGGSFTVTTANAAYPWSDPAPDPTKRFYRARISLP